MVITNPISIFRLFGKVSLDRQIAPGSRNIVFSQLEMDGDETAIVIVCP